VLLSTSASSTADTQNMPPKNPYKCGVLNCNRSFQTCDALLQHSSTVHGSAHAAPQTVNRPYRCDSPGCGRSFEERGSLLQHRNDTHRAHSSRPVAINPRQPSPQTPSFLQWLLTHVSGAQYDISSVADRPPPPPPYQ